LFIKIIKTVTFLLLMAELCKYLD